GFVEVAALDGQVTADRKADVRRTATVELVDHRGELAPLLSSSALHPLTEREIRVWRGIEGVAASDEYPLVPMATVLFETLAISDDIPPRTYTIGGDDREAELGRLDWPDAVTIDEGTSPADLTATVLAAVWPGYSYTPTF